MRSGCCRSFNGANMVTEYLACHANALLCCVPLDAPLIIPIWLSLPGWEVLTGIILVLPWNVRCGCSVMHVPFISVWFCCGRFGSVLII
jgi:hypothetical protein